MGIPLWKIAFGRGTKPKIDTPEELADLAVKYFEWALDDYMLEYDIRNCDKSLQDVEIPHRNPLSMRAFHLHSGVSDARIRELKKRPEWEDVIKNIENVIYQDKFNGAAAGLFNANIVARDLGLVDKKQVENTENVKVILYAPDKKRAIDQPKTTINIDQYQIDLDKKLEF